jgi:putative NADH-flavin reductase
MNITVFGASGGTGTAFAEQALAGGHEVTAVVRDPARLKIAPGPGLQVITADVMDPASIAPTLAGADAVVNTVGPHGLGHTTIQRDSVRSILQAMRQARARRLLHVSGSSTVDDGDSWYMRFPVKPLARATFLGSSCTDMRGAETMIRASDAEWTIFRPPALKSKQARGYRTAIDRNLPHGFSITRADLAACMLAMLPDQATVRHHVGVAN